MTSKRIVLCADDYGQNSAISAGILTLAKTGRLSASSCMSAAKDWPEAARELRETDPDIDIGLHFTLVDEAFLDSQALGAYGYTDSGDADYGNAHNCKSFTSLGALIRAAYLRQLDKAAVIRALDSQITLFQEHLGRLPDFIDGHQHIHQLPVIRDALLEICSTRMSDHPFYIRSLAHISARPPAVFKSLIIQMLGAKQLERGLRHQRIPHNPDFSGIHDFIQDDYQAHMQDWLGKVDNGALIMCHPAHPGQDPGDPIRHSREIEYEYLNSDAFSEDCRNFNIKLVRGREAGWSSVKGKT